MSARTLASNPALELHILHVAASNCRPDHALPILPLLPLEILTLGLGRRHKSVQHVMTVLGVEANFCRNPWSAPYAWMQRHALVIIESYSDSDSRPSVDAFRRSI